jgi:hypothetical protein
MTTLKLARNRPAENEVHRAMKKDGWPEWASLPQVYTAGPGPSWAFVSIVNREHCGGLPTSPLRWHISLRGPGRVPSWGELAQAAHSLRPGVPFVISVPPRSMWMNVHPHVLHLWETDDDALLEEWKANAMGATPT